jgi:deoxyribodipyrimidine photo-lyase
MSAPALPPPAPASRLRVANAAAISARGRYVLYWMTAARRTRSNFALQHAVSRAVELGLPLVVLEPLRAGYAWASDRHHRFVLDGMADQQATFDAAGVRYHAYVEPAPGAGRGLLLAWAAEAALVVGDQSPVFFLPRMVAAAARALPCRLELVDGVGLLPLSATDRPYATAHALRRHLHKTLPPHLLERPVARPLDGLPAQPPVEPPAGLLAAWPAAAPTLLAGDPAALRALPIDHSVGVVDLRGGERAAQAAWVEAQARVARYHEDRNAPDLPGGTGLSPYLHFGHISAQQVTFDVLDAEGWTPSRLSAPTGSREGWWGAAPGAEGLLDELITWRELGQHFAHHAPDWDQFSTLPDWALRTMGEHLADPRPVTYTPAQLEAAQTHDPLWNAAQRELVQTGRMHNYLRMLWGKKVYEWSESPAAAFALLLHLNNKYALDGRDPNSVSGVSWVFGRFDRAWGPERPIFGTLRYMSSDNTAKKLPVKGYLRRFGPKAGAQLSLLG